MGSPDRRDRLLQFRHGHAGAALRPRHGGDVLFHQGAADIVAAPAQSLRGPRQPQFDPTRLMIGNPIAQIQARDCRQVQDMA